jgi:hypothetical protein
MPTGKRWPWRWWQSLGRPWQVAVLAALFAVVWWLVPPLLYRHTGADAEAQLKAITDTRTAMLAGLIGVGALLAFWLKQPAVPAYPTRPAHRPLYQGHRAARQ